jgi:hypothetical protein
MKPNAAFEPAEASASPTGVQGHAYETPNVRLRDGAEVHRDAWPRIDDAIDSTAVFRAPRGEGVVPEGLPGEDGRETMRQHRETAVAVREP